MELELDLKEILRLLRKRLDILIFVPLIALVTSLVFSFLILTPVYDSSTTLIVNKPEAVNPSIDYNTILANKQIAKTYEEIAKSRTVMEDVMNKLKLDVTLDEFSNMVKVDTVGDTELIQITITDTDAKRAKIIAGTLADSFINKIGKTMKVENVNIVDPPVENKIPVKPRKIFNAAISLILGFIMALAMVLIIHYVDNTIKTQEDVESTLDLSVLGTIPIID